MTFPVVQIDGADHYVVHKNAKGDNLHIYVQPWKTALLVHMRYWFTDARQPGQLFPSKQGITFPVSRHDDVIEAIRVACLPYLE